MKLESVRKSALLLENGPLTPRAFRGPSDKQPGDPSLCRRHRPSLFFSGARGPGPLWNLRFSVAKPHFFLTSDQQPHTSGR